MPGRETTHRYPRIAVIANPGAGSTDPTYVRGIEELCRAHSAHTEVFWTRRRVHAAALARRVACAVPGYDAVVSVGGDGTLREVVTGLRAAEVARRPTLVVQPGGTANSNFRSLWDDVPWQNALTSALTGAGAEERELDLALFAELQRIVVLGTSTGLFAEATAAALDVPVAGRARYQVALNAVQASYVPYTGRVTVDGTVLHKGRTVLVNVGGSRYRAGVFDVLPHSLRDDGLLDVCVIGGEVTAAEALTLMRTGAHLAADGVVYGRGRSITVERTDGEPLRFEHDGEVVPGDATSFTVDVVPAALPFAVSTRRREG